MMRLWGMVALLVLVWGCSPQQTSVSSSAPAQVIGREAQAQEEEIDEQMIPVSVEMPEVEMTEVEMTEVDMPEAEIPEVTMQDVQESAAILGVVSDEPLDEALQESTETLMEEGKGVSEEAITGSEV